MCKMFIEQTQGHSPILEKIGIKSIELTGKKQILDLERR